MRAYCSHCKEHVTLLLSKGGLEAKCSICKNKISANSQKWAPRIVGDGRNGG